MMGTEVNLFQFVKKAGNIIVHNIKTVHYFEESKGNNPRYTWYFEFRTIDQLKSYSS